MTRPEIVYEYLRENYADNEPILLSDISIPGMKDVFVRQQIKKMTDCGCLNRFDTGIYYFPKKSIFLSGSALSLDEIITKKYLMDGKQRCGYFTGLFFANQLGITTQVPAVYEICTNKATTEYREVKLADIRLIIRKPLTAVTDENANILQFLDLLKEVISISEIDRESLSSRLIEYMNRKKIGFDSIKQYLPLYPDRIYKNMFEVKLLNGISA